MNTSSQATGPSPSTPVFEAVDLTVERFRGRGERHMGLRQISLRLESGGFLVLAGEEGAGISLLGRLLAAGSPPGVRVLGGRLELRGEDLLAHKRKRRREICRDEVSLVSADPRKTFDPLCTVRENLREFVRARRLGGDRLAEDRLNETFYQVGMVEPERVLEKRVRRLDTFTVARLALVRVLLAETKILVCDGLSGSLDLVGRDRWIELVAQLHSEQGWSVMMTRRDLRGVCRYADHLAVFYEGGILEQGSPEELLDRPRFDYTRALSGASLGLEEPRGPISVPSREALKEAEEAIHGSPVGAEAPVDSSAGESGTK